MIGKDYDYSIKFPCPDHHTVGFNIDCLDCLSMPNFLVTGNRLTAVKPSSEAVASDYIRRWADRERERFELVLAVRRGDGGTENIA